MQLIDISKAQRAAIYAALQPHAALFEAVGVYGSRAMGKARPGSDIDLVVYGTQDTDHFYTVKSAIIDSDLSVFADIMRYEDVSHPLLKREIDAHVKILLCRQDFQPSHVK